MSPYNLKLSAFERWQPVLQLLLDGGEHRIPTAEPHKLGYRLREAIRAAKHNAKQHPECAEYGELDYEFAQDGNMLIARPRKKLMVGEAEKVSIIPLVFYDATSEFDVAELLGAHTLDRYIFPNFSGSLDSVRSLCKHKQLEITSINPLTIERRTDEAPSIHREQGVP